MNNNYTWIDELLFIARNSKIKAERDQAVNQLVENGYCTHYPGYICDREFPKACPNCIKRTFNLEKARAARLYSVHPGEKE